MLDWKNSGKWFVPQEDEQECLCCKIDCKYNDSYCIEQAWLYLVDQQDIARMDSFY